MLGKVATKDAGTGISGVVTMQLWLLLREQPWIESDGNAKPISVYRYYTFHYELENVWLSGNRRGGLRFGGVRAAALPAHPQIWSSPRQIPKTQMYYGRFANEL